MTITKFKKLNYFYAGASGLGMRVEIEPELEDGMKIESENLLNPIATILADEDTEQLFIELYTINGTIQIPMESFKNIIEFSETKVYSETWYLNNISSDE